MRWWFLRGKKIDLAQILACPTCKGKLFRKEGTYECASCRLSYPIQAEIPILLKETASPLR
ncbi:MAG: Trm112 family protein [Elusimicrobiota bacterium]